jgi:hypothetical protein
MTHNYLRSIFRRRGPTADGAMAETAISNLQRRKSGARWPLMMQRAVQAVLSNPDLLT